VATFWSSLGCGKSRSALGQCQFSFPGESRWVPASPARSSKSASVVKGSGGKLRGQDFCDSQTQDQRAWDGDCEEHLTPQATSLPAEPERERNDPISFLRGWGVGLLWFVEFEERETRETRRTGKPRNITRAARRPVFGTWPLISRMVVLTSLRVCEKSRSPVINHSASAAIAQVGNFASVGSRG
jgi:hypothetical protein